MRSRFVLVLLVAAVVLGACSTAAEIADDAALTNDAAPASDADIATGEGTTEAPLSSVEVYETIRESIVFVESPDQALRGSGIVIEGGWILTNAHLVERLDQVRIGRSDGVDLGMVGVHAVDWIFDLALLGPIDDDSLVPIDRRSSTDVPIGTRVLLVGFPDENSARPTPSLTEGIVSRRRSVAVGDFSFLQVDATIAPGQSGGALVDEQGRLMGISGLEFGTGEFGLAFAADAMWPRVEDLAAVSSPQVLNGEPVDEFFEEIGPLRTLGFLVEVDESGALDISARSSADVFINVQSLAGSTVSQFRPSPDPFLELPTRDVLFIDEQVAGGEDVIATVEPGTYQVIVGSLAERLETVTVLASNEIRPFVDLEEEQTLPIGEIVEGQIDWSGDSDRWKLPLTEGQQVEITIDGIGDVVIAVRLDGVTVTSSDDDGLGVYGDGARVTFEAAADGEFTVEVGNFDPGRWGYLLEVLVTD